MFSLPELLLQDTCMKIDALGRLEFCETNAEAVFVTFALHLRANDTDDWKISRMSIGTQEMVEGTQVWLHFCQIIEADGDCLSQIQEHIADYLGDAKVAAEFDAMPAYKKAG